MFDLASFTLSDMTELGAHLRKLGAGATTMEEVANRVVSHIYDGAVDPRSSAPACALVRFFKTHAYGDLEPGLQSFADQKLGGARPTPEMRCLALLATRGERPDWNTPRKSLGHRAIPLASAELIGSAPMISQLMSQLGVEVEQLLGTESSILVESRPASFNVFYVPEAVGSPYIPDQENFVIPVGVESVLGFGGRLPSGDIFSVILFSKVHIPRETANLFKTLALNVEVAVMPFEEAVFAAPRS